MRIFVFLFLLVRVSALCQNSIIPHEKPQKKKSVKWTDIRTPVILIGAGLIATTDNEVFDKWEIYDIRNQISPHFHTSTDNYIQFAPILGVYALNAFGLKGKHNILNQTALMLKSEILMGAFVFGIKHLTAVDRPDTEIDTSFPSGHTAQAFAAASVLHHEYGVDHPWISVLGYSAASCVGVLRIMNNRHWISDVLAGAGIGMLSTNLIYATHHKCGRKSKRITTRVAPFYQRQATGISLTLHINNYFHL